MAAAGAAMRHCQRTLLASQMGSMAATSLSTGSLSSKRLLIGQGEEEGVAGQERFSPHSRRIASRRFLIRPGEMDFGDPVAIPMVWMGR